MLAPLSGIDSSKYRTSVLDTYKTGGKQYGRLPLLERVLFYNKALFDKAGVKYPDRFVDLADEEAAAKKLTDKSAGVWGDYQPITYNEFYKALEQTGGARSSATTARSPRSMTMLDSVQRHGWPARAA